MKERIDLALHDVVADLSGPGAAEHRELVAGAVQSDGFMSCVLAVMMPSNDAVTTRLILAMSMMLWAGMRIERARQEADALDRMYGKDLA
jgi:hypothetical protein